MCRKSNFVKGLLVILWFFILSSEAFAQNCSEERCVDGKCVIIPRNDLPGCDHPDDNFSVSNVVPQSTGYNYQYPDLITFLQGYHEDFSLLVDRLRKGESFTDVNSFAGDLLGSSKLLVIPSGGLYGLDNSQIFKALLDEYVKNGGTLIVFAQQHGYEFSILPVPQEVDGTYRTISGYGWTEDQSCLWNGTYVDTYHQMLSAITTSTVSANVDGYFTNYPSNSTILLRRTANGQPAMLNYEYGNGRIIVSSMYSDWGYAHSQATQDEIKIVRDMISWAKSPAVLPEIKPAQAVSVSLSVTNNTTTDAASVKLLIYDPDRKNLLAEQSIGQSIPAGQSIAIPVSYTSAAISPLGIYYIGYILLDNAGNIIQPQAETDSGRFIVSNPMSNPAQIAQLSFSIQSDSEQYASGSTATFTIIAFNNSDAERTVTAKYDWSTKTQTLLVPPKSSSSFTYSKIVSSSGRLQVSYYDENNKPLFSSFKGYWVYGPSVNVDIQTDKTLYNRSEAVNLTLNLQNKQNATYTTILKIRVSDPLNTNIYNTAVDVNLTANGTSTQILSFELSSSAQRGFYTVSAEAYDATGKKIGGDSASFEHPQSQISVTPNISSALITGTNNIPFNISNRGRIGISSGTLDVSLRDPDGAVIYTGIQPFTLADGESRTLDIPISIPPLKFGNYTLTYTQSNETRTGRPLSMIILNSSSVNISLDKPSYKIGETANITILMNNTGKFRQDGTLTIDILSLGFTDTKAIAVNPSEIVTTPYSFTLPLTLSSGGNINATFITASGNQLTKTLSLSIAPIVINQSIVFNKASYRIRENLGMNYTITNNGNFSSPLFASFSLSIPDLNYTYNSSLILEPGITVDVPLSVAIPETISAGQHQILTSLTLPSGVIHQNNFNFTVPESSLTIGYSGQTTLQIGDTIDIGVANTGGVDTDLTYRVTLSGNNVTIYQNTINDTIQANTTKTYSFQTPSQSSSGSYALYLEVLDKKTNKRTSLTKGVAISGVSAGLSVRTDKDIYLSTENITSLSQIINQAYGIDNANLHLQIVNKCSYWGEEASYYISTWDGNSWVERGLLHYSNTLETQLIDLSAYLPDAAGEYKIRIRHEGIDDARIDYITLMADGVAYTPASAISLTTNNDILGAISSADSWTAYVLNNETEIAWIGVPTATNKILLMRAQEGAINYSACIERTYYQTDVPITQAANTTINLSHIVNPLYDTGQFYLQGTLTSRTGQIITQAEFPFNIISGDIALRFRTDKAIYRSGEAVTITGSIVNLAAIEAAGITVEIRDNNWSTIYTNTFNIPANGFQTFNFTTTAGSEGVYQLYGELYQAASYLTSMTDKYEVAAPMLTATATTPSVVGRSPFELGITINNTGKVPATIQLSATGGTISDTQTLTLQPKETRLIQYTQSIATDTTYTINITGDLNQVLTIPVVYGEAGSITLTTQAEYPEGEIILYYTTTNIGKIETTYPVTFALLDSNNQELSRYTQEYLLPVGAAAQGKIAYNLSVGSYILKYSTIGYQGEAVLNVIKPGKGNLVLTPLQVYLEGYITIPYTITNTTFFGSEYNINFELKDQAGNILNITNKKVYLNSSEIYTEGIEYNLTKGSYTITAQLTTYPASSVSHAFSVLKENDISMTTTIGQQTAGLIPVISTITNLGYNNIDGSVLLSVITPSTGQAVWNGEQSITQLATGNSQLITFNINPSAIQPGNYTLKAELLNNSNQQLAVSSQPLAITGATFQITELSAYQTFNPGQEALFTFKVKNTGNQDGAVELSFKAYDLIDSTMREWLMPNEEKTITFNLPMPTDLEENDYFAEYEMRAVSGQPSAIKGQVKYHLAGINLAVNAFLDKQNYNIGDTARLTINVTQQSALGSQNLFARVNYAGYENQQAFTLNGSQTLSFDIPLTQITGEKLFYGIYQESGRSIHLNSLYIYKTGDVISITTDKQVYNPGETVSATISGNTSGQMTFTGPGGYTETFAFTGTAAKGFALPLTMAAGTYFINAQLSASTGQTYTASHPIDVAGIQVKVKEAILDKAKYLSQDNMNLSLTIESNQNLPAALKAWVVDPEGRYTAVGEGAITLSSAELLLYTNNYSLTTAVSGIHRIVYGIYTGDLLLSSGSEAFDIGDAVLLGLSTNKTDYSTNTEPVNVKASIYGTGGANLEIQIDGTPVKTEPVTLNGFTTLNIDIGTTNPGAHTIKGILTTNGLTSTKQAGFVYGSNLPDLTAAVSAQLSAISINNTLQITATIMNQGKTPSAATTLSLYDGENLIETRSTNALNPGEMQEITFNWNILGKAGVHIIKAIVDPDNTVIEYNEQNNTAIATITIPDITMSLATDAETYKTNKNIGINTQITNLTASTNYQDIILNTEIRNPSGLTIYTKADTIALLPASTSTNYITAWNTESNIAGIYTIRQTITAGQTTTTKEKQITIEQTTEFSGSIIPDSQIIFKGKDLKASYTVTNIGNTEINNQRLQVAITDSITKEVLKQAEIPFSLKIKEQITGTATISQIDLEPKDYNLNLIAIIDNTTYTIAATTITVKLPLQITKGIGTWPRVLVYIEGRHDMEHGSGGKGQEDIDKTKEQIANLLTIMNINHIIVTKEEDFIANFRSGKHNIYMIIEADNEDGSQKSEEKAADLGKQYIWKELTEAINNGEGLIYIKTHPDEKPDLRDVLGVKIKGEEKDAEQLTLIESPITNAGVINLTDEEAIEIVLEKAKAVAYINNTKGHKGKGDTQLPAITINNYGNGKAILFTFNPIDNNNPILNQAIINAINYITPDAEKIELTTNSITPINTRIINLGEEIILRITELLPEGIKLIEAYNQASTEPLTWEITLKPNEAKDIRYIIQLSDKTGTYDITSRIEYQVNGIYKNYGDTILTLDIQKGFTKILQNAIDNINKLTLIGEDTERAEEVKELLSKVINRGIDNKEKQIDNIRDLLKAVEKLNKITVNTTNIRLDIDRALRMVEGKIYY